MAERINKLSELKFGQLMAVYEEGNRESGMLNYPKLSSERQLMAAEQDFYQYLTVFFADPESFYMVLCHQSSYVAALRMEPYRDGLLLEALETRPDARRKGFAEKLVRETMAMLKTDETTVYSHISKSNIPSIGVHEKCGFKRILEHAVYIDGSVNQRAYTYCCHPK